MGSKIAEHQTVEIIPNDVAPQWAKFRKEMLKSFPSPYRGEKDSLADGINIAVRELDKLKPEKNSGAAFLGTDSSLTIDFDNVKNSFLNSKMSSSEDVIKQVIKLFEGMPNWGHPLTMNNVNPQANTAAIIAAILSEIFAPNILEGEYAWNIHQAELESGGILANLVGWESKKAGCVYTYGGSGCWTYHLKYALTRVLPDSRNKGIRTDAKVICSQQAHYTMLNSTDWMGLGMDNIIRIKTDIETNAMDMNHLEEVLKDCQAKKIPVASVVCTMATTDANAFDPVEEVRKLMDKYPNPKGYGKTLLYCDSVIGWSWIVFKNYDFKKNTLGFSEAVLPYLEKNYNAIYKKSKKNSLPSAIIDKKYNIENLNRVNILLVEDNQLNIKLISSLFSENNLKFQVTENGISCIAKLKENNFDIVLLDMEMPIMNGYDTALFIRNDLKSNIPIIAMTANAMAGEKEKCLNLGMNDYISKPINANLLFEKISDLTLNS